MDTSFLSDLSARLHPLDWTHDLDPQSEVEFRESGVLLLLFPHAGEATLILTERPHTLSRHAGQISLPGGARDPSDANLLETALRETREEIGASTDRLQVLGRLGPVHVLASGYVITPYVAWTDERPSVRPDPAEVASVFETPLAALLDESRIEEETWTFRGAEWRVCFYRLADHVVWGATARILSDLAVRLGLNPARCLPGSVERLD